MKNKNSNKELQQKPMYERPKVRLIKPISLGSTTTTTSATTAGKVK